MGDEGGLGRLLRIGLNSSFMVHAQLEAIDNPIQRLLGLVVLHCAALSLLCGFLMQPGRLLFGDFFKIEKSHFY